MQKIKMLSVFIVGMTVFSAIGATFEDLSKSFVVLQSSKGDEYLCAAVKMNGATYVVTSQSLFLNPIPKFRLLAFNGKPINDTDFEIDKVGDFVRIKIADSPDVKSLEIAANQSGRITAYSMDPDSGIVFQSDAKGNLVKKDFPAVCGSPIINDKGEFVGVSSRTDDGLGKKLEIKLAPLSKDVSWSPEKSFLFAKQVYLISELLEFTQALDKVNENNVKDQFIMIDSDTHPKLLSWLKDQNKKAFDALTSKKTGKGSMGKAMREHQARCFQYSGMKRLTAFYSSNATQAQKGKWSSVYIKERAKSLYNNNKASANKMKSSMKSMVEMYPSVKAKF